MAHPPRTPRLRPGSPAFVALIAALMTMTAMTIDINLPAIPATAQALGSTEALAQLTVTSFFAGFAVGQGICGPLSDRIGRRPVLLAGIVAFIVVSLACALAPAMPALLALRFLQGAAASTGSVLGRAIIRDRFVGAEMARVMSFAMAAFVTAPIIAPSLGALILAVSNWQTIFVFLAGYGAVLLVLAWRFLDESLTSPDPHAGSLHRVVADWRAVLTDPVSRGWTLVVTLAFADLTIYLAHAPVVLMSGYGLSPTAFGLLFAIIAGFSALGNLVNARLVRRLPLPRVVTIGLVGSGSAVAVSLTAHLLGFGGPPALLIGFGGFFLGFGLIAPNATALALAPHGRIVGSAAAVLGVVQTVVPATLASVTALLSDGTSLAMLTTMLVCLLLALAARIWQSRGKMPNLEAFHEGDV